MKTAITAALLAASLQLVSAHYTFPDLIVNGAVTGDWQYVRETANHYSQGPVTSVTDPEFRCYELDLTNTAGETSTATVNAGSTIGVKADQAIYHPGYWDIYLSPASPAANSESAGTGKTWFKIWENAPVYSASSHSLTFPSETQTQFSATIPASIPSGQYLVRFEQIALHSASSFGGAQFYISCGQINVVGGGGTPVPSSYLTSIPGVYTGNEPGILINIYNLPSGYSGYQSPGPAVYHG